jgi:hypothetical protein
LFCDGKQEKRKEERKRKRKREIGIPEIWV